jgi:hypothetical protein
MGVTPFRVKAQNILADKTCSMKTKLLLSAAILFWILVSKTDDLLFTFFAVYSSALTISFFFFKRDQKRQGKSGGDQKLPQSQTARPKAK